MLITLTNILGMVKEQMFIDLLMSVVFYVTQRYSVVKSGMQLLLLMAYCIMRASKVICKHGYIEMIFAVSHLIGVTFAPRIKDISSIKLASFNKIKPKSAKDEYPVTPGHYIKESKIRRNWDTILRLIATIMLRKHRASTILKGLSAYDNQYPLEEVIKKFGRVIKSIFILKYIDDITEAYREDQEISPMCKTIVQNIIILWNYIELTKIIMRSNKEMRKVLLENITSASILRWQHVSSESVI